MNQLYKKTAGSKLLNSAKIYTALFLFSLVYASTGLATNYVPNTFADPTITTLNNATGEINGTATISLRSALMAADNLGGTHTITLGTGTYLLTGSSTYPLVGSLPVVPYRTIFFGNTTQNITINGNGPANTIIDMAAAGQDRIFAINYDGVTADVTTTINGVKFTDGNLTLDTYGGAALYAGPINGNAQTLTINNCTFDNNICPTAGGNGGVGGAINMFQGTLNIDNSTFTNNKSIDADGGAIVYNLYNQGDNGILTITNSTFSGNTAGNTGGAIFFSAQGSPMVGQTFLATITENTFINNTATGFGGGIFVSNAMNVSTPAINYNRFVGNTSTAGAASSGLHFAESVGSVNAENNWWGCNTGPTASPCNRAGGDVAGGGSLDANPWLQLRTTASPTSICNTAASVPTNTSTITASFLNNSDGTAIPLSNLSRVLNLPVTWTAALGTLSGQQTTIQPGTGTATALFTSNGTAGNATVDAQVDNIPLADANARASITVNAASVAPTGATGVTTICNNTSTILTVTGGVKGTGYSTQWYTGSCGGTLEFTGDIFTTPLLTTTTTYYVRYTGFCNTTLCATVLVTVLPPVIYGNVSLSPAAAVNHLVISQVYGGGGNAGAPYLNDFIELFNPTGSTVSLTGWSVQYAAAAGSSWAVTNLTGSIAPGKYYLVQQNSSGANGVALPSPDATDNTALAATAGKVALVSNTTALTGTCPTGGAIVDFVGYGATANCFEGAGPTPAPSNTNAVLRAANGCTETDNNLTDFSAGAPTPRNSASPANICSGALTETICSNSIPSPMSVSGASGGAGTFTYQWYYQQPPVACPSGTSTVGWTPLTIAQGTGFNTTTFTPTAAVTADISYAVLVTPTGSPICGPPTWATGCRQVIVNNVTGGTVGTDQVFCTPADPAQFNETIASTGDGTLTYKWQSSTTDCTTGFSDIAPPATGTTYDPPAGLTTTTYYRRVTTSTLNSIICTANSNCITVTVNPDNTASAPSSTPTLCINTLMTTITHTTTGATGIANDNVTGANGLPPGVSAHWEASIITISGTPTTPGTFNYIIPLTGGCGTNNATGSITVNPNNTVSAPSSMPTLCISTSLTSITHTTTGATGIANDGVAGANSLPAGVAATWAANTITISGTPTAAGTFNYSILLTGGCVPVSALGTITVTPNNTASAPSSTPALCINTVLTNITHTTTGATGIPNDGVAGANGLPAGVAATWAANTITISGTPTVAGTFNYSILLTGGCGTINAMGTITVNQIPDVTQPADQTVCNNTATAAVNFTGSVPGTTFNWANNTPSIGLAASGSGNIVSFTATNGTNAPVTATVTVTPSTGGGASGLIPEVLYYKFDGSGTTVPNLASAPPPGTATANLMGGLTQGGSAICNGTIIGTGESSATDYLNTNWAPNLGTGSWTISFKSENIAPSSTLYYFFGDINTNGFRCFTNGVAGPNNWILRGGGLNDIIISGGATVAPHTNTFVYDNTLNQVRAYLDGVLVSTVAQGVVNLTGAGPFKVNGYSTNIGSPLNGHFDEFRLFNRALSPAEVLSLNGCDPICTGSPQTFTITVNPTPVTPTITPGGPTTFCTGGSVTLTSSSATGNQWYLDGNPIGGATNQNHVATTSGNYTVVVTQLGCPSAPSAAITVIVNPDNTAGAASSTPTLCIGTLMTTITHTTTGATGIANDGVPGANGLPPGVAASWAANTITLSGTPTVAGTFNYSILLTGGCGTVSATGTITVTPDNTVTLTSGAGTPIQTVVINQAMTTPITYSTTGATGIANNGVAGANGLPAGVSATWAANMITIDGTPTALGVFNYTVTLTGGCGIITATGTITVVPCSITLTSAAGTDAQTLCNNTPIINIAYATVGATGASFAGFPAGVNGTWAANVATISGTPTAAGIFNYTVTLTGGGCGAVNATGTITVNPNPVVSITPPGPTTICAGSNLTLTASAICNRVGFSGLLTGSQEVPPNASTARGLFYGSFNPANNQLTFTVIFDGLSAGASAAHIHNGVMGVNGPIIVSLTGFPAATSGTYTNTFTLSAANAALLLAGNTYVNIHNPTFPAGELRGQITNLVTNGYTIAGPINGGMEVPPNASTATGNFAGTYSDVTNQLMINVIFNNLTGGNANAAHIHTGTAGSNGPIIIPLPGFPAAASGNYSLTAAVPAANLATFMAGNTYINIHNALFPGGEIRGQIAAPVAMCAPNTYLWSPGGATTQSITVSTANTYTVTVTDGNNCIGSASTVVNVNPIPVGSASPQTICSGGATSVTLHSTTPAAGTTYSYTAAIQTTPAGGTITGQGSGTANPIAQTLINTGTTFGVIRYTVTPSYTNAGVTCAGAAFTVDVTVNPTPNAVATTPSQTKCSGVPITTIALTGNVAGTVFNWTRDMNAEATGIAANGAGDISGTLTNTTNAPVLVTFTIIPTANGCPGPSITATVLVNPTPNAVATPSSQTKCSGVPITAIVLNGSAVAGTIYNWTRNMNAEATGIAANGAGDISGTLTNTTNAPVLVTFTIIPTANGCPGPSIIATVLVNPTPNAVATPISQTVCSGTPITTISLTGNVAGTIFNWTRTNTASTTGIPTSGSGDISGTLTNTTNAPVLVTFTIIPTANGCPGPSITVTVLVNPTPIVNTIANQVLCNNGSTLPVNFSSPATGGSIVFNWTNSQPSIGLGAFGTGNIPSFTAINNGPVPATAIITVTASYTNGGITCIGPSKTFTIKVNPQVGGSIIGASNNEICNGQAASININLTGIPPFTGLFNIEVISGVGSNTSLLFTPLVSGLSAVSIPASKLINNSSLTTIYRISWISLADASGCAVTLNGAVNIHVLPGSSLNVSDGPGMVCPGSEISFTVTSPNNGSFSWQAHDGTGVIASGVNVAYGPHAVNYTSNACPYNKTLTFTFIPSSGPMNCGGSAGLTRTVVVQDLTPPTFTVNAALLNTSIECTNTSAITAARSYTPSASDNCSNPTVTEAESFVAGCGGTGTYTTVFTAMDACGNTATVTQTITVTDNTAPVIGAIAPQALGCSGVIPNYITQLNLAAITTDCGPGVSLQQLPPYAPGSPTTGLSGTITIVIEATDGCGNRSTKSFTVTLTPGAPTAVCKSSVPTLFVNLSAAGTATITPALIDGGSFSNCSSITMTVSPSTFTCANIGVNAVTLTVTDASGNTAQCTTNVTVRDVTPPTLTACPANITIAGGLNCSGTATWTPPTATDNCANPTLTGTHTPGQSFNAGTTTVTYTATDASGNSVTCSFTVTVVGSGALALTCPGSITANTNAAGCKASVATPNPTITGNCGAILSWAVTGATNSSGTGNLGTFLFNVGTSVVTYTASDGSGNSVTCSYTVIVTNAVAGSISGTATVQQSPVTTSPVTFTGSGGQSPYTFTYTINGTPQPAITSVGNTATLQQSNAAVGSFAYQLTAVTDANGCAGTLSQPTTATITVVVAGVPDLIVIPTQSSSQIAPGGTLQEVFTIRNIGTGPTTGPVTFTINRFAPGSGLTASLNTALSVNIGFDNFILHNNNEAGWSVVTTVSTFTFTYTGVIATGVAGSKNVGVTVTRGGPPIQGANGISNQTVTIPGGTGGGESPTSNNSATVTIVKN